MASPASEMLVEYPFLFNTCFVIANINLNFITIATQIHDWDNYPRKIV
jgi:hypothetical protein